MQAPAWRGIDQGAEPRSRAERVALLEIVVRPRRAFRGGINTHLAPRAPGAAEARIRRDSQGLRAVACHGALPADRHMPGLGLEEFVARREREDTDWDQALDARVGALVAARAQVEELDLRAADVAGVVVEDVVVG